MTNNSIQIFLLRISAHKRVLKTIDIIIIMPPMEGMSDLLVICDLGPSALIL